ncbi:tyrosine-type recombinase/integrase [Methylobacterium mesophilicum SR1.6/6]|uniref:Tyrosine-type recombinase/integrase n=1 Tax=Methylobacterium mesophilicum SR1.6/6 TaxID=908290 RepID=A0A6B9FHW6_9HYPH|nr:site-specific integrase [Methylobacterium mesophilicum]QGY01612.1 tyrosine-type recombinase/integrase [Methylobacterium mesophilicum SR1.6/6]
MRVRLKGLNSKRKRLADGTWRTYFYAYKGGPRLKGEPGTPEFMSCYQEAVSRHSQTAADTLSSVLRRFQASDAFRSLSVATRRDYVRYIRMIDAEFEDFPLSALSDKRTRGEFMAWRDRLAMRSRRGADYAWAVLARILSWAIDRGLVLANPCERGGRLYRASRADKVWSDDDEARFLASAPAHLHLALILALWTGQRQGDLLRLPWAAYDGAAIRLTQQKTGARVYVPVGAPLKAALDAMPRTSGMILLNSDGRSWTSDGFRTSWRKACFAAGITGLTFHDLRGTAVSRLAMAGASSAEIATLTGHSLRDVDAILDSHYLHRDPAMAQEAIRRLEARTKLPDRAPDRV